MTKKWDNKKESFLLKPQKWLILFATHNNQYWSADDHLDRDYKIHGLSFHSTSNVHKPKQMDWGSVAFQMWNSSQV